MTWESIGKALMPSVQSAVYALLAMLIGAGTTYAVNKEKPAVAPPVAQQTQKLDDTKIQLTALENKLDDVRATLWEMRRDLTPRTAAKSK